MMYTKKYIIIAVLFFSLCSFAGNGGGIWNKIDNKLYSLKLPSHWIPEQAGSEQADPMIPKERDASSIGYHLYYLRWGTPWNEKTITDRVFIFIESYQKLDKTPVSIKAIEDLEMKKTSSPIKLCNKEDIWPQKGQRRFFITIECQEMDGQIVRYRVYYLLQKSRDKVHCVSFRMRDAYAQKHPEEVNVVKKIMDSFVVK